MRKNEPVPPARKTLRLWLDEYAVSHQNRVNIVLHKVCVPLIFWSLLGLLAGLPHWSARLALGILIVSSLVFYARLSLRVFAVMLGVLALCAGSYAALLDRGVPLFEVSLAVFVAAWIGQFVGHRIEGKKPSFFEDLQFLLIGPLWVVYSLVPR